MRSLSIVILDEDSEPLLSAGLAAHPGGVKAVDPHSEGVKPLFDVVSERVVEPTAEIKAREGSQIAVAIDQKHGVCEVVFPVKRAQKHRCSVGSTSFEELSAEQKFCLGVD